VYVNAYVNNRRSGKYTMKNNMRDSIAPGYITDGTCKQKKVVVIVITIIYSLLLMELPT